MSANAWCTREVWGFIHYLFRCYNLLNIVRSGDISCWDTLQNDKGEHRCHQPQWAGSKARPRGKGGGGWCNGSADAITAARYHHRLGTVHFGSTGAALTPPEIYHATWKKCGRKTISLPWKWPLGVYKSLRSESIGWTYWTSSNHHKLIHKNLL